MQTYKELTLDFTKNNFETVTRLCKNVEISIYVTLKNSRFTKMLKRSIHDPNHKLHGLLPNKVEDIRDRITRASGERL